MSVPAYRAFGRTGLQISSFGLGTATFGGQCDEAQSFAIMDRADELGISFFDTADKYPIGSGPERAGVTETIVGRWWRGRRDQFILASKVHGTTGPRPWDGGLSRRHIMAAVDASLRRLQTDYLDIYQLHRPDPLTPIEETLVALTDIVRSGKVRYVGCSNFLAYQLALALGKSETHGLARLSSVQPRYNLLFRQHERELLPLCEQEGLAALTYNALAGGMLTGKHTRDGAALAGSRFANEGAGQLYRDRYLHDDAFDVVDRIRTLAGDLGMSMATLATAWVQSQPVVTSVILGATNPQQLDIAAAAGEVDLDAAVLDELDQLTRRFRMGDDIQ
ncbi:MAG: NADP-dependent oxidoreductase domain protein [Frankiales bacterium]|nr:NADP-dependent oxidoreductase domain protein [Frankiales bacterium]